MKRIVCAAVALIIGAAAHAAVVDGTTFDPLQFDKNKNGRIDPGESFEKMLSRTFDDTWAFSPSRQSVSRKRYDLQIVRDPLKAFLFEATRLDRGGEEIRVVRTSSERLPRSQRSR